MMKSTSGTPANTIKGTRESVSMSVLWYNGSTDSGPPNR